MAVIGTFINLFFEEVDGKDAAQRGAGTAGRRLRANMECRHDSGNIQGIGAAGIQTGEAET